MSTILVQTRTFRQKMRTLFVPSAIALFLSACTNTSFFQNPVTESLKNEAYATSEFYINKAEQSAKLEDQQSYRLLAIRKLLDENKAAEAQNTIAMLQVAQFNDIQKTEYNLLLAQLAALQGNNAQANAQLKQLPQTQLSSAQLLRVYQTQARVAENQNDIVGALRARAWIDSYLSDNQSRLDNNNKIWATLRNANRGMIENVQPNPGEMGLAGWIALIKTYHQNISNPSQLPQALQAWKVQYPNHSAVNILPTELQNVLNFQQTQLHSVGLLLPFSGEAKGLSAIIKKGFDDAKGADPMTVQLFDTDSAPISTLLAQAKQQGVQTLIGPLLKPRVDELVTSPEAENLNILALNATPNVKSAAKICYYGLSPESEARSAAEQLHKDGLTTAIVAVPNGDFGIRSADAFAQRWLQLTGKDANVRYYNQPAEILAVLQNYGGQGSGLYVLGTAEQLLDFKQGLDNSAFAGQFPIYTSSRSNSPNNGADFRLTMEGVKFSEIPLLADISSQEYKKAKDLAESDFSMMRLYAMGSDTWLLANKFNELRQIPGYKVSGLTGVLSSGTNCNIEREMTWLQYRNGATISVN